MRYTEKGPKGPSSLIYLDSVLPNPYAKLNLYYCKDNTDCTAESRKVKVCPSVINLGASVWFAMIANPHTEKCRNPDLDFPDGSSATSMVRLGLPGQLSRWRMFVEPFSMHTYKAVEKPT